MAAKGPAKAATKVLKKGKPTVLTKAAELRLLGKAVTAAEELGLISLVVRCCNFIPVFVLKAPGCSA